MQEHEEETRGNQSGSAIIPIEELDRTVGALSLEPGHRFWIDDYLVMRERRQRSHRRLLEGV